MSKHTQGPWTLETVRTQVGICHKIGPFPGSKDDMKDRHACLYADYPSSTNPRDIELLANARLIAAAPELLESLQLVTMTAGWQYMMAETRDLINAAIAKATGDTT